jgi:hypothetical protein
MMRFTLGTVIGIVVAFAVLMGIELLSHALYPPPDAIRVAIEKHDYAAMRSLVKDYFPKAPLMALVLIPVAWVAGTFLGALAATGISRGRSIVPAIIVGGLILAGTIANLMMIPHPLWMTLAGVLGVPAAAIVAWWLWPKAPAAAAGPQPYDMREKNMAC